MKSDKTIAYKLGVGAGNAALSALFGYLFSNILADAFPESLVSIFANYPLEVVIICAASGTLGLLIGWNAKKHLIKRELRMDLSSAKIKIKAFEQMKNEELQYAMGYKEELMSLPYLERAVCAGAFECEGAEFDARRLDPEEEEGKAISHVAESGFIKLEELSRSGIFRITPGKKLTLVQEYFPGTIRYILEKKRRGYVLDSNGKKELRIEMFHEGPGLVVTTPDGITHKVENLESREAMRLLNISFDESLSDEELFADGFPEIDYDGTNQMRDDG